MSNEKMREEFEAAYIRDVVGLATEMPELWLEVGSDGEYRSFQARGAWWGWQASRAAVVVSLPIDVSGGLYRLAVEDCTRCIEAAGLQVKP